MVKNLPVMQETLGPWVKKTLWSLGQEDGRSPGRGHGNSLHCSCLENSMDRGAWQATVRGITKRWTWLSDLAHASAHRQVRGLPGGEKMVRVCLCPWRWTHLSWIRQVCLPRLRHPQPGVALSHLSVSLPSVPCHSRLAINSSSYLSLDLFVRVDEAIRWD